MLNLLNSAQIVMCFVLQSFYTTTTTTTTTRTTRTTITTTTTTATTQVITMYSFDQTVIKHHAVLRTL